MASEDKTYEEQFDELCIKNKIEVKGKDIKKLETLGIDDYYKPLILQVEDFIKSNDEDCVLSVGKEAIKIYAKKEEPEKENITEIIISLIDKKEITSACYQLASYFLRKYHLITFSDTGEIYIYIDGVYTPRGEEILARESQKILKDYCKLNLISEILGHIKRSTITDRKLIKEPINKICLQNGIVNLNNLTIEEHSPDVFFFNKIPVLYVSSADCPRIKKFLSEIVKEDAVILLQEFAGYCLYKEHFIHKAFMLVGNGANGKSTFLRLLKIFLGGENVTSIPLQNLEINRFALSSMFGKLANIFADLPERALIGTSIFKMLVGQDLIPAEKKFRDLFFFENYAKLIFSANQIPKSPEDTDAFFRRWEIINFPNQFLKNADKKIMKKLITPEELSGFLNFAIDGLKKLLEQGDFSSAKSIQEVREQYIRMSDSVKAFIMDKILISPDNFVQKKVLYTSYCDYCRENNYPILAENTFHKDLQASIRVEDYRPTLEVDGKKERVQCWKGIKIILNRENNLDNPDNPDGNEGNKAEDVKGVNDVNPFLPIKIPKIKGKDKKDVNPVNDVRVFSKPEFMSKENEP